MSESFLLYNKGIISNVRFNFPSFKTILKLINQ